MTEEKNVGQKEKEVQNEEINKFLSQKELEILNKYIVMTKYVIGKLFPKLSDITDLSAVSSIVNSTIIQVQKEFERMDQKNQNHTNNGESNKNNSTSPVNIESLINSLSFKTAKKNGDLRYAFIDMELARKLPKTFEMNGKKYSVKMYENEKKAVIYEENIQKLKNVKKQ